MSHQSSFAGLAGNVLVSACLLGLRCRYDGSSRTLRSLSKVSDITIIPVCPEQLGGLSTPRPRAYLAGGDGGAVIEGAAQVIDAQGRDVTGAFLLGAAQACRIARILRVRYAILKERSPSCGTHRVHVGGRVCDGLGVTAAMLRRQGVIVVNEDGSGV